MEPICRIKKIAIRDREAKSDNHVVAAGENGTFYGTTGLPLGVSYFFQ
jgi:hypothetical protein